MPFQFTLRTLLLLFVVLALWRYRQPRADLTVRDFFLALARLGGHHD